MENPNEIVITTHDKLLRGWENSKELVRDFQNYAKEIRDDPRASELFASFAEDEATHAAMLNELLRGYQN